MHYIIDYLLKFCWSIFLSYQYWSHEHTQKLICIKYILPVWFTNHHDKTFVNMFLQYTGSINLSTKHVLADKSSISFVCEDTGDTFESFDDPLMQKQLAINSVKLSVT